MGRPLLFPDKVLPLPPVGILQQVISLEPAVQRSPAQAEPLGGRPLVAMRVGKHPHDVIPFDEMQVLRKRAVVASCIRGPALRAIHAGLQG